MLLQEREEIMTAEEVAELLRLAPTTVRRMAQRGELPGFNATGSKVRVQWRFRREDIERLVGAER